MTTSLSVCSHGLMPLFVCFWSSTAQGVNTGAKDLAAALGNVTILQKGPTDVITNGVETVECNEEGGLKRCGGQGDVLSGTTACFLAWAKTFEEEHGDKEIPLEKMTMLAALGGAVGALCLPF